MKEPINPSNWVNLKMTHCCYRAILTSSNWHFLDKCLPAIIPQNVLSRMNSYTWHSLSTFSSLFLAAIQPLQAIYLYILLYQLMRPRSTDTLSKASQYCFVSAFVVPVNSLPYLWVRIKSGKNNVKNHWKLLGPLSSTFQAWCNCIYSQPRIVLVGLTSYEVCKPQ